MKSFLERRDFCIAASLTVQCVLFLLAGLGAFLLRFDFRIPANQTAHVYYALTIWLLVKSVLFHVFTVNRGSWRFVAVSDLLRLLVANASASILAGILIYMLSPHGFPRSIYISDFVLCLLFTAGVRVAVRLLAESIAARVKTDRQRALIYGAGAAGRLLLHDIVSTPALGYKVCGFIDDDPAKAGVFIHGVGVLGAGENLEAVAARHSAQQVLIAIPSASGAEMVKILNYCSAAKLDFRTVPTLSEVMSSQRTVAPVRELAVGDLLGRAPVQMEDERVRGKLQDRTIMVTGAAGSIGSELCRQIAHFQPKQIIGFDMSETGLFYLERELKERFPDVCFEPVIGSVQSVNRLNEVFASHQISTVYHAAAYKHVPIMEANLFEAVENNVIGTYNVAITAARYRVPDFVMISSDKAIHPTSVMGLTKRVAEVLVRSMQKNVTNYVSVRFGNVLGSNGSVVPIFQQQIAAGGPVTVTHPEMRRFFMTIVEAVQLVLQASTMGRGGEIFVLDMGQPMKIVDLVRNMILLSGHMPGDIPIKFTGTRAGEKLYEEVNLYEEHTQPTHHEKVRIFSGDGVHIPDAASWIDGISQLCLARDLRIILCFKQLVPDYNPSSFVLEHLMEAKPSTPSLADDSEEVSRVSSNPLQMTA